MGQYSPASGSELVSMRSLLLAALLAVIWTQVQSGVTEVKNDDAATIDQTSKDDNEREGKQLFTDGRRRRGPMRRKSSEDDPRGYYYHDYYYNYNDYWYDYWPRQGPNGSPGGRNKRPPAGIEGKSPEDDRAVYYYDPYYYDPYYYYWKNGQRPEIADRQPMKGKSSEDDRAVYYYDPYYYDPWKNGQRPETADRQPMKGKSSEDDPRGYYYNYDFYYDCYWKNRGVGAN